MCVCVHARVCLWIKLWERDREKENVCMCVKMGVLWILMTSPDIARDIITQHTHTQVFVYMWLSACVCVHVCQLWSRRFCSSGTKQQLLSPAHPELWLCLCLRVCVWMCVRDRGDSKLKWWVYRRGNSLQPSDSVAVDISFFVPFTHFLISFSFSCFLISFFPLFSSTVLLSSPYFPSLFCLLFLFSSFSAVPHAPLISSPLFSLGIVRQYGYSHQ